MVMPRRSPSSDPLDAPWVVTSSEVLGWSVNWKAASPVAGMSADAMERVWPEGVIEPTCHSDPPAATGPADQTAAARTATPASIKRRDGLIAGSSPIFPSRLSPASRVEGRLRIEDVRKVLNGGVARAHGRHAPALLDGGEDRGRVVLRVVDHEVAAQARRDDQGRDPGAGAPLVVRPDGAALSRRRDVVPLAAELVVGHDDHGVLPARAAVDRLQKADEVVAAAVLAGVAGVLVFEPDRLDEAHRV